MRQAPRKDSEDLQVACFRIFHTLHLGLTVCRNNAATCHASLSAL